MKWIIGGIVVYFALNWYKGQQFDAEMKACGWPTGNCPHLDSLNREWAWLPDPSRLAGPL